MASLSILIHGSRGRMGRAVASAAADKGVSIAGEVDMGDDLSKALPGADVVIDFSSHLATHRLLELCVASGKPIVIGTTGHGTEEKRRLLELAARVPCVWTGNYSVGVNVLAHLTERAASLLSLDYHAEIVEAHHMFKKDAPSGTANLLLDAVLQARDLKAEEVCYGRQGITGQRSPREVGVHALRMGDVVGDHTVYFAGPGERLELTHRAGDRSVFAHGAVRAAVWVRGQKPGVYSMRDVLGLK